MAPPPSTPRSTLSPDYQRDWPEYFDAVEGQPPRDTLLRALDAFDQGRPADAGASPVAIDIACGEGRDSRAILARPMNWTVWSLDYHADAVARTRAKLPPAAAARCRVVQVAMEEIPGHPELPASVDLINASFALPFCKPEAFDALWTWIVRTIRVGGRFSGQFFGDRDEWRCVRPKSHRTRREVEALLESFHVEHLQEVLKEGDDATGKAKFHHVFHIVARRKPDA
jgi:SAM-dependent methyltransferase